MVCATGVLELLGALGQVMTATRRLSGMALAFFFLVLPASIYAAVVDIPFAGE